MSSADFRKQTDSAVQYLVALGYQAVRSGAGHWKITDPVTGKSVFQGSTPSDPRSVKNFVACVKREFGVDMGKLLSDSKLMKRAIKQAKQDEK